MWKDGKFNFNNITCNEILLLFINLLLFMIILNQFKQRKYKLEHKILCLIQILIHVTIKSICLVIKYMRKSQIFIRFYESSYILYHI